MAAGPIGVNATTGQETWATFVLAHLTEQSVLLQAGVRFVPVDGMVAHLPRTTGDGLATWVAEATEIPSSAPTADDVVLTPKKLANVVSLSSESIQDAPVSELDLVGASLTRAVATAVDKTAFSAAAATPVAPAGLLAAAHSLPPQTGGVADADAFLTAIGTIEAAGGAATAIFVNPGDKLALTLLKDATGSERPLLQPDVTQGGAYSIGGVRLWPTSAIAAGTSLVAQADQIVVGVRKDVQVDFSTDARFTSDQTVARVIFRADWSWSDTSGAVLIGV